MITRGDGVGIEVCGRAIRGVMLRARVATRLSVVKEVAGHVDGPERMLEAMTRLRAELGPTDAPTRIAWFAGGSALQRIDASDLDGRQLDELRQRLAREHGINSTLLHDADGARWMVTVRWRTDQAWELQELAESAGFVDVEVEPAPIALRRVLPRTTTAAVRVNDADESWVVVVDGDAPIAAAHLELADDGRLPDGRLPRLTATSGRCATDGLTDLLGVDAVADAVAAAVGRDIDLGRGTVPELRLPDQPYPHFPHHDFRSAERCAVALGAAVGAAGLAGRARPVDVVGRRPERISDLPRPWAIEEVRDVGDHPDHRGHRDHPDHPDAAGDGVGVDASTRTGRWFRRGQRRRR